MPFLKPRVVPVFIISSLGCCPAHMHSDTCKGIITWVPRIVFDFIIFNPHPRTCLLTFRERGRGRERNINQLPLLRPIGGTHTPPQPCALTRNRTRALWVYRTTPQPSEPCRSGLIFFMYKCNPCLLYRR
ncbi:hypothetical protein HJG60_008667 [Phyllostomus discolor]|uniref:Uncharacterized protein n=1 Tax=Phyllostomus discolor TaxID=89673 RepID=A0A833YY51_9CHIR|nr:hypothetical protein HJG60_008667 [Phyllostomus discolor]